MADKNLTVGFPNAQFGAIMKAAAAHFGHRAEIKVFDEIKDKSEGTGKYKWGVKPNPVSAEDYMIKVLRNVCLEPYLKAAASKEAEALNAKKETLKKSLKM